MPRRCNRVYITCLTCGERFAVKLSLSNRKYCSALCRSKAYVGAGNPKWRGGRIDDGNGRTLIYAPGDPNATQMGGKYAYEYRLTAAKKIGRPLLDNEIVHHINGDHTDNRPENLEVMTQSAHVSEHRSDLSEARRFSLRHGRSGAKINEEKALSIRASKASNRALAAQFGVNRSVISRIRSGQAWGWL